MFQSAFAPRSARTAHATPTTAAVAFGALSATDRIPLPSALALSPTRSVIGRSASPMLRIASSHCWPTSRQICVDVSRRASRSRWISPLACCALRFRFVYSSAFCMYAVSAALTCMSLNRSPVFIVSANAAICASRLAGSISALNCFAATESCFAFSGSTCSMYARARTNDASKVDQPLPIASRILD